MSLSTRILQSSRCRQGSFSRVLQRHRLKSSSAASPVAAYNQSVDYFPSLIIGANKRLEAVGSFAEAQAMYLDPDPASVSLLAEALQTTQSGVVAHYYMDVELQGVLQAASKVLGDARIGIADSLKMGDMAVDMCRDLNVQNVACLGVDFMSESVQTILQKNGHGDIPVYRATKSPIGCSLAESAEREGYRAWLQKESAGQNALHVIYINTSLETKAVSSSIVPTITCTSSNVLATLLQASAQMKDDNLKILYGPDTYMGRNLETLLDIILATPSWTNDKIASDLHPQHNRDSLQRLRESIHVFPSGNCVVHHMFGNAVVDAVKRNYSDAYVTAHLEVPGEMFEIAMSKSLTDDGVVGSTSDILKFISRKVQSAASRGAKDRFKFILGTEAGMVTSIVQSVQQILEETGNEGVEAEIIFPVASDAVMATDEGDSSLPLVPGVAGGEGCSTAGGCATCPFMKMNDLDAVLDVLSMIESGKTDALRSHLPPDRLSGKLINGHSAVDLATESIMFMRDFMQTQQLSNSLVDQVLRRQR
ncbi:hypothetical protein MPSEU_000323200 [Mayamaea pseudoterrestris]|nr:hypothetical protein MPSEU_000323200 [Mayamaea pseudoterrestris]